jgi:methylmalonyl-CoA mutase cobalamin-binding subunit
MGITGVFRPGTPMRAIVDFITRYARTRAEAV